LEGTSEAVRSLAPSDAAVTGIYNPHEANWDAMLLGIVSGDQEPVLRRMLAPVKTIEVPGEVRASSWLVRRYGFAEGEPAAG
jgi:glycerol kinase